MVKSLPVNANAGDVKRRWFGPWVGKIPRGGHGNPLQCSCLETPTDRGGWRAAVQRVAKSWTQLKRPSNSNSRFTMLCCFQVRAKTCSHTHTHIHPLHVLYSDRLVQNPGWSSLGYTGCPYGLSYLYTVTCVC